MPCHSGGDQRSALRRWFSPPNLVEPGSLVSDVLCAPGSCLAAGVFGLQEHTTTSGFFVSECVWWGSRSTQVRFVKQVTLPMEPFCHSPNANFLRTNIRPQEKIPHETLYDEFQSQ